MSYSNIKKKLESGQVIILDGAIGGELEKVGAPMDKNLWAGKCSNDCPDLVLKVHEKYIEAGADVITTNTYALAPVSMKQYGYQDNITNWNLKSVEIAKTAAKNLDWEELARRYNGPANVAVYAPRLSRQYAAFTGTTSVI